MDTGLAIGLLLVAVAAAIGHPRWMPAWAVPAGAAILDVVLGVVGPGSAGDAVRPLLAPVGFLLAAVPLAVMLDRMGLFTALASRVTERGAGPGYLWALAAVVTTVLNLDAGVVLLTPLYVRVARRRGWDVVSLALQPVLLACLASSALPVSNLTNLIAVSWSGATTAQFLAHLALPSVVAAIVGWWLYRTTVLPPSMRRAALGQATTTGTDGASPGPEAPPSGPGPEAQQSGPGREAPPWGTKVGGGVVIAVLVGFTCGPLVGVQPWMVALVADLVLLASLACAARSGDGYPRGGQDVVPWNSVPLGTAALVLALGVAATAAARYLPIGPLLQGRGVADLARDAGLAALGANVVNNLPTLLIALPRIGHHTPPSLWAVLLGVNMGPVLLVTGSLASLLWLSTLHRMGVEVRARDFTRAGLRAGLPAAAAALGAALLLSLAGVS
jgi:arsenical pump membrane protein